MKIVINTIYGRFELSEECCNTLGDLVNRPNLRTNPNFVRLVERDSDWASGEEAALKVVEIPDDITDWEIENYDGIEAVTYVRNGRIYHQYK